MGAVIGIGIVEAGEAIAGIIAGAGAAEGAAAAAAAAAAEAAAGTAAESAAAAAAAAAAGDASAAAAASEAAAAAAEEAAASAAENAGNAAARKAAEKAAEAAEKAAGDAAAAQAAAAGESEEAAAAARAAAEAAAAESAGANFIVSAEEQEVLDLIEKIRPLSENIANMFEEYNAEINAMLNEGVISEEAAVASQEIADVTDAEIEATGMTRSTFEAFEIEAAPEFEELSEETQSMYQQLKKLGKKIINKVKQALMACKKSKLRVAECIIALGETIEFLHKQFFSKHAKFPPNVLPSFSGTDPYQLGQVVGQMTAKGIGIYYDQLLKDPKLVRNEKAMDLLILHGFQDVTNYVQNTLARRLYGMIRASKFIKDEKVQKKFDEINKIYTGKLQKFPYRDQKTKLITYIDETGKKIAYKDVTNLQSVTTFYGTWCGPKSYNDTIPLWEGRKPEAGKQIRTAGTGLLDSFCMAHDCDYSFKSTGDIGRGGWFNQEGDFILISRILHNLDLMTYKEKTLAMMTVAWFSTLGTILNTYLHPLVVSFETRDPTREEKESDGDLYSLLFPKRKKKTLEGQYDGRIQLQGNKDKQKETPEVHERKAFYKGLQDQLMESQVDFLAKNGHAFKNKDYSTLLHQFDNLRTVKVN